MKNLSSLITEGGDISIEVLNEIKGVIEKGLDNKFSFTISCDGFNLNDRFSNRVGGYAIESILSQILGGESNIADASYKGHAIEIKSIKDEKYSAFDKMFTTKEIEHIDNVIVIYVDYTHSGNKYTIKTISICLGSDVKDVNPKKAIADAKIKISNE